MATTLEAVLWIHGAPNCAESTDPLVQIHQVDEDSFILRESKCFSFEGNFIYLLFGEDRVVVFDTGARPDPPRQDILHIRETVDGIIEAWVKHRGGGAVDLIVAHTHNHLDHAGWDSQFKSRPRTTVVMPQLPEVKAFFGLRHWPDGEATLELGNRALIVFPIPGHETSHIAIYDRRNKWLLTGDMLYAGLLTIQDWSAYRASAARLNLFADSHEVVYVLGNHIEMKNQPKQLYPIGTKFQPEEHVLPLTVSHIRELHAACEAMANNPHVDVHDEVIIAP